MSNTTDKLRIIALTFPFLFATCASAQTPNPAHTPSAIPQPANGVPVPQQLISARKAFVSNAGGSNNALSQQAYMDFYHTLLKANRYQLTDKPEDADIILELSADPRHHNAVYGTPLLQLNIRDPKTQTVLWSFAEAGKDMNTVNSVANLMLARTAAQLVGDLDALTTGQNQPKKKIRFQQEKP